MMARVAPAIPPGGDTPHDGLVDGFALAVTYVDSWGLARDTSPTDGRRGRPQSRVPMTWRM